jgi:hypothetical protein
VPWVRPVTEAAACSRFALRYARSATAGESRLRRQAAECVPDGETRVAPRRRRDRRDDAGQRGAGTTNSAPPMISPSPVRSVSSSAMPASFVPATPIASAATMRIAATAEAGKAPDQAACRTNPVVGWNVPEGDGSPIPAALAPCRPLPLSALSERLSRGTRLGRGGGTGAADHGRRSGTRDAIARR